MRIAIDCRVFLLKDAGQGAGVAQYVSYLVKELLRMDQKNEYILFFDDRLKKESVMSFINSAKNVEIAYFPFQKFQKYLPFIYSQYLVARAIKKKKPDIVYIPAGGIPLFLKIPTVLTVHDVIIYEHPEWFPSQPVSVKFLYPWSVKKAAHIICVSETTKRDVKRLFRKEESEISVVYPGVTVSEDTETKDASAMKSAKPYVLFLGTIEPRKNVGVLVRGFVEAWKNSSAVQKTELVIAGRCGWKEKETMEIITDAAKETRGSVRYLGYVRDEERFSLIKNASAFAFLSHNEGFGLPILEAMSLGTPTLVSDIPVFHEIAKDAVLFVNQKDTKSIADGFQKILTDEHLREQLRESGLRNARRFSWGVAAEETIRVYEEVFLRQK